MASKKVGIKLTANISDFQSKMSKVQKGFKKTGKALKKVGKSMTIGLTLPMAAFAAASIKAFDTQAKAEAKLLTALDGNKKAFAELKTQAEALQKVTLFGDEETMAAQSMLAAMGLEAEAIKKLTPLVQDMATAKGMDLSAAADLVAKSVGSSTNAMSRYGIQIEGAVGSSERLDSAIAGLSGQFEGQSKAAADAGAGGLKQLQNSFGDLMEDVGGMLIPLLNKLVSFIKGLVDAWGGLDKGTKVIIISIAGVIALIGPAISLFGFLAGVIGALSWPIVLIIAGLAALVAAIMYAADNWTAISEQANKVFAIVRNALISILQFFLKNNIFSWLIDGYNKVMKAFGKEGIKNPFESIAEKLEEFKVDVPKAETKFKNFFTSIKNSAAKAADAMGGIGAGLGVGGPTGTPKKREQETAIKLSNQPTETGGGMIIRPDIEFPTERVLSFEETVFNAMDGITGKIGEFAEKWGTAIGQAAELVGQALDGQQIKLDNYYNSEAEKIEKSKMNEEDKQKALLKLNEKVAKKQAAIDKKKAIADKAMAMFQAVIQTAANVTKVIANPAMAVLVGALGAAQIAAIAAAPIPAMENGGVLSAGQPALVGEAGPEIFQPTTGGMVLPNSALNGAKDVNVNGQFVVSGTDLVAAVNNQLENEYGDTSKMRNTFGVNTSIFSF
jgi:hypothetical protein